MEAAKEQDSRHSLAEKSQYIIVGPDEATLDEAINLSDDLIDADDSRSSRLGRSRCVSLQHSRRAWRCGLRPRGRLWRRGWRARDDGPRPNSPRRTADPEQTVESVKEDVQWAKTLK